jgi:gamma-glutamyltranspeptidase / glutathione hydrolase
VPDSVRGVSGQIARVAEGRPGSGAVAAGSHPTCDAAASMLRQGGNAIDAAVAGAFAATVAEPTLASLGGGGFCLTADPGAAPLVTDFFVDMPRHDSPDAVAPMESLEVTFGSGIRQEFHVGWSSVAVPGTLAGLLHLHSRGGRLPLDAIITPARDAARQGIYLDEVQVDFIRVIGPILRLTEASAALFSPPLDGRPFVNPAYADLLDQLARGASAEDAFGDALGEAMRAHGGLVTAADIDAYSVTERVPIRARRDAAWIWTNPPPAFGGAIVLESLGHVPADDPWPHLVDALRTSTDRHRSAPRVTRGTTHLSVVDDEGRVASLSLSNGSGSGTVVRGVALNNMLGEADLHPGGFHALPPGERLSSMMAPTLVVDDSGDLMALGTGGSERIRSALVQVLVRYRDLGEDLAAAIAAPRLHAGDAHVDIEPGFPVHVEAHIAEAHPPVRVWPSPDLYFGGVHAVARAADGSVTAVADARRGGAVAIV